MEKKMTEEEKALYEKYKSFIEESSIREIKELCDKGELNINAKPDEIWVVNYFGDSPESQCEVLLNQLINSEVTKLIAADPKDLFKKIYAVKDYRDQQDIIVILNKDKIYSDELFNYYQDTLDMFTLKNYLDDQLPKLGTYEKEEYDPLDFKGQQEKIDDIDNKLKNGDITLGEALQKLGLIGEGDYDKEKVIGIIEKLINKEIGNNEIQDMIKNKELNSIELNTISDILKNKYKEIYNELNQ